MKNLLNTIVFKSVALFAMVLLVPLAVTTSFNPIDQSNDIGGKNKDIIKHVTDNPIADIGGGGKGTSTTLKEDIGGRKDVTSGNLALNDIGGSRDHVIIRRIPIPFTSEIGGKSTTLGQ